MVGVWLVPGWLMVVNLVTCADRGSRLGHWDVSWETSHHSLATKQLVFVSLCLPQFDRDAPSDHHRTTIGP